MHHQTGTDWMIAFEDPLMNHSTVWNVETIPNSGHDPKVDTTLANFCVVAVTLATVVLIVCICQYNTDALDKRKRTMILLLSSVPTLLAFLTFVMVWQSCDAVSVMHGCFAVVIGCYLAGFVFIWLSDNPAPIPNNQKEKDIVLIQTETETTQNQSAIINDSIQEMEVPNDVPFFSHDFGSVSCALGYEPDPCSSSVGP